MLAVSLQSGSARPGDIAIDDDTQRDHREIGAINLSHDLVRLGIASRNLRPDSRRSTRDHYSKQRSDMRKAIPYISSPSTAAPITSRRPRIPRLISVFRRSHT
jgi:hypothetical protein